MTAVQEGENPPRFGAKALCTPYFLVCQSSISIIRSSIRRKVINGQLNILMPCRCLPYLACDCSGNSPRVILAPWIFFAASWGLSPGPQTGQREKQQDCSHVLANAPNLWQSSGRVSSELNTSGQYEMVYSCTSRSPGFHVCDKQAAGPGSFFIAIV